MGEREPDAGQPGRISKNFHLTYADTRKLWDLTAWMRTENDMAETIPEAEVVRRLIRRAWDEMKRE